VTVNCVQATIAPEWFSEQAARRERLQQFEGEIRRHEEFVAELNIFDRIFSDLVRQPNLKTANGVQFVDLVKDALNRLDRSDKIPIERISTIGCENIVPQDCRIYIPWGSSSMHVNFAFRTIGSRPTHFPLSQVCGLPLPLETIRAPCSFFESQGPHIRLSFSFGQMRNWKPHLLSLMLGDGSMYAKAWEGDKTYPMSLNTPYALEYFFFTRSGSLVKVSYEVSYDRYWIDFFYKTEQTKD
jgi:hypothetical protein